MKNIFDELKQLAESGNAEAQYHLGMKYVQEREDYIVNPDSAFYWLEASATQGYLPAQKKLGKLYDMYYILSPEYGWKVRRFDDEKSRKWWKVAADNGDAESMYHLGMYYKGLVRHGKITGEIQPYMAVSDHFRMVEKTVFNAFNVKVRYGLDMQLLRWLIYTKNAVMNMKNMIDRELLECTSALSRCVNMLFHLITPIKLSIMKLLGG